MARRKEYFMEANQESDKSVLVTGYSVNIRSAPSLTSNVLTTSIEGERLVYLDTVLDADGVEWYEVRHNGKHGFICGKYSRMVE